MSLNRNKTIDSVQVLTIGLYISGFTLFIGLTLLIVDLISNRYLSTTTEISTLGYIGSFFHASKYDGYYTCNLNSDNRRRQRRVITTLFKLKIIYYQ